MLHMCNVDLLFTADFVGGDFIAGEVVVGEFEGGSSEGATIGIADMTCEKAH